MVNEFNIGNSRADVIGLTKNSLVTYEIKSDVDTAVRLAGQAKDYDLVSTDLYLVTTDKHIQKMEGIIPPWWGILVASGEPGSVVIREHRDARGNPAWNIYDTLRLLWVAELDEIMRRHQMPARSGKPKAVKSKRVASTLGKEAARQECFDALVRRFSHPEFEGHGTRILLPR